MASASLAVHGWRLDFAASGVASSVDGQEWRFVPYDDFKPSGYGMLEALTFIYDERTTSGIRPAKMDDSIRSTTDAGELNFVWSFSEEQKEQFFNIEFNAPDFFIALAGQWLAVNFDFKFIATPNAMLDKEGWVFTVDLSHLLEGVTAEAMRFDCNGLLGHSIQAFVGKIKKRLSKPHVTVQVRSSISLEDVVPKSAVVALVTVSFALRQYMLRRSRLAGDIRQDLDLDTGYPSAVVGRRNSC